MKALRKYTPAELARVQYRPFPSRLFITNIQVEWNTVWLRTRHTDHHAHTSSFIQVRDALKADEISNNPIAAKYALTELLNMCYGMKESDYYSFACTLASAFSREAENTEFEDKLLLLAEGEEDETRKANFANLKESLLRVDPAISDKRIQQTILQERQFMARERLLQLMHIVFSKLKQKQLLVDQDKNNIYRLVLCMTKYNRSQWPFFYAMLSFFFQMCAALYVVLSLTDLDHPEEDGFERWDINLFARNIALALGTLSYGGMVAYPEVKSTSQILKRLYHFDCSFLMLMDFLVNIILPVTVAFSGFFVVRAMLAEIDCFPCISFF